MTKMYLVTKNADFTEGRGPMLAHKLFSNLEGARKYIAGQKGVYGSPQYDKPYFGYIGERFKGFSERRADGSEYPINTDESWNGYGIKEMEVES